jgi:rhodanese-related sulfurtransferase
MSYKNLNLEEFTNLSQSLPDAKVIDCRTFGELKFRSLKYDIHLDVSNPGFLNQVKELDKSKPYFIYCASGGRSSMLCSYLERQGFGNLYNLSTGVM